MICLFEKRTGYVTWGSIRGNAAFLKKRGASKIHLLPDEQLTRKEWVETRPSLKDGDSIITGEKSFVTVSTSYDSGKQTPNDNGMLRRFNSVNVYPDSEISFGVEEWAIEDNKNNTKTVGSIFTKIKLVAGTFHVTPDDEIVITYSSDANALENATLQYTIDNWATNVQLSMLCDNRTCNTTIPKQPAGSTVKYKISATDTLKTALKAEGQFIVKENSQILAFNVTKNPVTLGTNLTFTGTVSQAAAGESLELQFLTASDTQTVDCKSFENGTFTAEFLPTTSGIWTAQAFFRGNNQVYESESAIILVTVNEPTFIQQYGIFVFAGVVGALAAVGAVYYIRKRRSG